jgi:hypothetical protein
MVANIVQDKQPVELADVTEIGSLLCETPAGPIVFVRMHISFNATNGMIHKLTPFYTFFLWLVKNPA